MVKLLRTEQTVANAAAGLRVPNIGKTGRQGRELIDLKTERLKPLMSLLLIFVAAPLLSAVLCPWIYSWIQARSPDVMQWVQESEAAGTNLFWADIADSVFTSPMRRVNARIVLILVLILLWPAYRLSGLRGRIDFGIPRQHGWLRIIGGGMALAMVSMLIVYLAGVAAGVYVWDTDGMSAGKIGAELTGILLGGLLIGILEEILFRGFILNALRKSLGAVAAVVLSSLLFALVHFIKPVDPVVTDRWYSGFLLFGNLFARAGDAFAQEATTLFCMGTVLAVLSLWMRSVYAAIGLHAGWVWIMMGFRLFTENNGRMEWLYGTNEWISKAWIGPIMALTVLAVVFLTRIYWKDRGAGSRADRK